jgi:chemotaxis signal transduction protein
VRLARQNRLKHRSPQTHPVILFVVGEHTFAISAAAVIEIQALQEMQPLVSQGFRYSKVHHTITRDGRRYWVVDANIHFAMMPTQSTRVLMLAETPVAIKVDAIVRMAEMSKLLPLPDSFTGDERSWYLGLTLMNGTVVPLVNPASFLSHLDMNALEASALIHVPPAASIGVMA